MNSVYKSIEIDLYSPTSYEVIKAQQEDKNSRILEFKLYNQGEPYVITDGVSLQFIGQRGDGSYFFKDKNDNCITFENNKIMVSLTDDILYYAGIIEAKLVMFDDITGNVLSTVPFKISCIKSPCDESGLSEGEKSKIADLIFQVKAFSKNAEKIVSDAKEYADASYENKTQAESLRNETARHENYARQYAENAEQCVGWAENHSNMSERYRDEASGYARDAEDYALLSESYAHGGTSTRPGENTDNARKYYEQAKEIYDNFQSSGNVRGVKGNAETEFRNGLVNITAENIGAYAKLNLGKSGYRYAYNCIAINNVDLDTIDESGLYYCDSCINTPSGINGYMIEITHAGSIRGVQIFSEAISVNTYIRQNTAGTWGAWGKIKAGESESATKADGVSTEVSTTNVARRVYFANTNATDTNAALVYDDDFKYNPVTNVLTVGSITGNAASATKATQDGNGNNIVNTYLPKSGGTITGNLTLKGSGNYGNKLNFGDGDYVYISEPTDDCLEIKAKKINFVLSDTTSSNFTINNNPLGSSAIFNGAYSSTTVKSFTVSPTCNYTYSGTPNDNKIKQLYTVSLRIIAVFNSFDRKDYTVDENITLITGWYRTCNGDYSSGVLIKSIYPKNYDGTVSTAFGSINLYLNALNSTCSSNNVLLYVSINSTGVINGLTILRIDVL